MSPLLVGRSRRTVHFIFVLVSVVIVVFAAFVPAGQSRAADGGVTSTTIGDPPPSADAGPAQQLADRYAPVVYLREVNSNICDTENEGFDPVAVDFVLKRDDIPLMKSVDGTANGARELVKDAPSAADLYGRDAGYYLDYPGSPVRPGCVYRRYFADRMSTENWPFVAYAHIYQEPGSHELALQYWMYYYFNDWNNNHEGDWEMVMLFFDANTAEEALTKEPTRVVYAQHGGGERSDWNDKKFSKEDGHPVVYVARGAHASFFEQRVYLGLAENGTGFGCETTRGPHRRDAMKAVVVPHTPTGPDDPFAWLAFDGRWGELRRSEWNGPTGPNDKTSWTQPVTWGNNVRDTSLTAPDFEGFGRAPLGIFCGAVSGGSRVLVAFTRAPAIAAGILGGLLVVLGLMFAYTSQETRGAYAYYRRHLHTFLLIGACLIPIAYLLAALQTLIFHIPPIGPFLAMMGRFPGVRIFLLLLVGSLNAVAALIFVEPTIVWAMGQFRRGRRPGVVESYQQGSRFIVPIIIARFRAILAALRQAITIVGIPRAIMMLVRMIFIPQTVVAGGDVPEKAIADSAKAVNVSVPRTLLTQLSLLMLTGLAGPLLALFLLVAIPTRPVDMVNFMSSIFFAFLYPFGVIGMTLLYERHRGGEAWQGETQTDGQVASAEA